MRWFLSDANLPVYFFQDCGKHCFMTLNFLPHTFQHRLLDFSKTCTVALLGISSREVSYRLFLCRCKCPACFMLVSCLFHACTCGKGPEALLTHDSYLSKSEELLLNIGQRRLKPWNNVILFMRTYMTCRISTNVKWNCFQGRNIACTLACNRQGWDAGNSLFNFMKALEVVYRCPTEKLFEIFQPDKKGGTTSGTDGEVYRAKEKVY